MGSMGLWEFRVLDTLKPPGHMTCQEHWKGKGRRRSPGFRLHDRGTGLHEAAMLLTAMWKKRVMAALKWNSEIIFENTIVLKDLQLAIFLSIPYIFQTWLKYKSYPPSHLPPWWWEARTEGKEGEQSHLSPEESLPLTDVAGPALISKT